MLHSTTSSEALETHLRRSGEGLDIKQSGEFILTTDIVDIEAHEVTETMRHEVAAEVDLHHLLNVTPTHGEEGGIHT